MEMIVYLYHLNLLQLLGITPFSVEANYMSLEGMARLLTFWLTGVWV